jgi:nitroreductase
MTRESEVSPRPLDFGHEKVLLDVMVNRRSCRSFIEQAISKNDLFDLIKAGIYAPSGSNSQNQRFLVIDDPKEIQRIGSIRWVWPYMSNVDRNKLRAREPHGIIGKSAAIIIVFADSSLNDRRNSGEYYIWESLEIQNCAASIQNILLLATAKGIGSCWVSCSQNMRYSRLLSGKAWQKVFKEYDIPFFYKVQGLIILGYPKHLDENGFPKGERIHGVVQCSTERANLAEYLISKRNDFSSRKNEDLSSSVALGKFDKIRLGVYTRLIRLSLRFIDKISKRVYRVEKKYLSDLP